MKILTKKIGTLFLFILMGTTVFAQFQAGNPVSQTVCEGNSVTFEVYYDDADAGGVNFDWNVGGVTFSGASGTILGINYMISTTNIFGNFYRTELRISNPTTAISGSAVDGRETISGDISSAATLTVNGSPTVTAIANVSTCDGQDAVFNSTVSGGTAPYNYTWTRYTGATNADFDSGTGAPSGAFSGTISGALVAITNSNIGVVVTDDNGCEASTTPASTTLTVSDAPVITAQPDASSSFCSGNNITLNVAANNATTYLWKKDAVDIGGATSASYDASASGSYTVVIGNTGCTVGNGAIISTIGVVTESPTLAITTQPASPNIEAGESGSSSVTVTAGDNRMISWFLSGEALSTGATTEGTTVSIGAETDNGGNSYTYTITLSNLAVGDEGKSLSATIADDCASINSIPVVLPVELAYVKVRQVENAAEITWRTLSEINNYGFEVERSFDGKSFMQIGFIEGAGTSVNALDYLFNDATPVSGVNYYRLRQVDFDGRFTYSEVVSIDFDKANSFVMNINPTASTNQVQIVLSEAFDKDLNVEIYDALGRKVMNTSIRTGTNVLPIDITSFTKGQYFVRLYNSDNTMTKTFFKL